MTEYTERRYRKKVNAQGLQVFQVALKETDLLVSAGRSLIAETRDRIFNSRHQIESYIRSHPDFRTALKPYADDPLAPPLVRTMIETTRAVGVGPMASVAGAVAESVGAGLLGLTDQVIVENGGDIFLKVARPATISIFAGNSPLSEKIGLLVSTKKMPLGVCTSSGTVGHSYSMGIADAACVIASSAALADGAATALCNMIQGKGDLNRLGSWAGGINGVMGCLVILGDNLAAWGDVELVEL